MEYLDVNAFRKMLNKVCDNVIANEDLLCRLDSVVGDGDHGVTAARGFSAMKNCIAGGDSISITQLLHLCGEVLSDTMGGAIGPIIGGMFIGMAEAAETFETINSSEITEMLAAGLENVMLIGGAKPGDRTLVDALAPAVDAAKEQVKKGSTLPQTMAAAEVAAQHGTESTRDMMAKRGRARFLQEKSLGYQDAGATSMLLVLQAMSDYCLE